MIKLSNTTDNQTISFIPRNYVSDATYNVKITTEGEGSEIHNSNTVGFTPVKYFYQYTAAFNFTLDTTYVLEITLDNNIVFQDRILVTNQSGDYSVNDQVYTYKSTPLNSTENKFKMYS
jgi:hypothetical protein|tara:strand:+ start:344 stop:700 length:357 start_codon:yes stop_codon:yes gene_type:complete